MTMKLGLLALVLIAAWYMLRPAGSGARDGRKQPARKGPAPMALEPCPRCGVYRAPGGACNCAPGPAGDA